MANIGGCLMAECKKYFRQKKGQWIWIWDNETRRNKKICLQDLLDRVNHVLRNENIIYFATTYDRDMYKTKAYLKSPYRIKTMN